jgi:hypothetical protein
MQHRHIARTGLAVTALALAWPGSAAARDLYVDGGIGAACTTYDPAARACGAGAAEAYATLAEAAGVAGAGDTVWIRDGTYRERLVPVASGEASAPLAFRAYAAEAPVVGEVDEPAILIAGLSYVELEGITVVDSLGWGRVEDSDHVVFRRMTFERALAEGTTGGLKLVRATHCLVVDCSFVDGNDNVVLQESDFNRIVDNVFDTGRHSLLSIRCSNHNVIRGNSFRNPDQKAAEIYDCEAVSDAPYRLDATRRNLFEGNRFELTLGSDQAHDYNAIQYAGQQGVVRRNLFHDNAGGGLGFQVYPDEALYSYGHRAYHNTFVANACYGIMASDDVSETFHDNVVRNNLLYENTGCAGEPGQTSIGNPAAVVLLDNVEATEDPGFVDTTGRDLRLADGSPMIDAAAFLTTASGAGSGVTLGVADAAWFWDGGGVEAEQGDLVQLEGTAERARVVAVDVEAGTVTLDRSLTWTAGQGLSLAWSGAGPDVGALEAGEPIEPDADADADTDVDADTDADTDADADADADGDADGDADADADSDTDGGDESGCDCGATPGPTGRGLVPLLLCLVAALAARRSSRH